MLGSKECLERAAALEARSTEADSDELRRDYLRAAEGWRDLARRLEEQESRERRG